MAANLAQLNKMRAVIRILELWVQDSISFPNVFGSVRFISSENQSLFKTSKLKYKKKVVQRVVQQELLAHRVIVLVKKLESLGTGSTIWPVRPVKLQYQNLDDHINQFSIGIAKPNGIAIASTSIAVCPFFEQHLIPNSAVCTALRAYNLEIE